MVKNVTEKMDGKDCLYGGLFPYLTEKEGD